ncbi:flagellar hook assembly protein FlgD [Yonghaparkia alkaliphila]|uniref:Flagellar hook assembly protein FlgD n=2 Tax=Microcella alkalica TaxID=355930 RepID=A0A839EB81_9MICO|nr:flagellar hook assembly protein FlgD [Microcella alkalica]
MPKVGLFGGKRAALAYAAENGRLQSLIDKHGLAEVEELDALKETYKKQLDELKAQMDASREAVARSAGELAAAVQRDVLSARAAVELQSYGLFDYEHPAESSTLLGSQLDALRSEIKQTIRGKRATQASSNFTFNGSTAKGKKFVSDMSNLLLRAYNAEAENCVKSVKAGNLPTATKRLNTVVEQIARQGTMIDLRITPHFHQLRMKELALAAEHLQARQREKELERAHREELREQRKAEQELARQKEKLEKERSHYVATLAALEANGDVEGAQRIRDRLADVDRAIEDVDYRAANIRAGYVYVISNVGSFGGDVVKIGMTRRLEPMDRVNELGDASVPFRFDVHALFFADDALGIEAKLHKKFDEHRINKVNLRREYFKVTPDAVLEALKAESVEVLEYVLEPEALEFKVSAAKSAPKISTGG